MWHSPCQLELDTAGRSSVCREPLLISVLGKWQCSWGSDSTRAQGIKCKSWQMIPSSFKGVILFYNPTTPAGPRMCRRIADFYSLIPLVSGTCGYRRGIIRDRLALNRLCSCIADEIQRVLLNLRCGISVVCWDYRHCFYRCSFQTSSEYILSDPYISVEISQIHLF